ncbi:MAG: dihydrolipoyl dehydrogenase [Bacillota bacterium]
MLLEIKLENLPNHAKEAKVTEVCKKAGDKVNGNDILFTVEANKSAMEIYADAVGIMEKITVQVGDLVKVGQVVAIIDGEKVQAHNTTNQFDYFANLLKPMKQEIKTDVAIIGGGPGGYVAAVKAAQLGANVVLIEKDSLGGTCLNRGCIPTKAFVRSAEIYSHLKNAEHYGCLASHVSLDMKKVLNRKNTVVNQLVQGIKYLLDKHKVKVIQGMGELLDTETVFIRNKTHETYVKAKNIIIATGSKKAVPPIPDLDLENIIDSDQALQLDKLPDKLVIIGGGVIGMEFAFIYANFGVKVSVIEYFDEILASCDSDICEEIGQIAAAKGISVYKGARLKKIIKSEDGQCIVSFIKDKEYYLTADKVLVAVGRQPELDGLGIEKLGIELNEHGKGIKVNSKMQTNISNIYAIGDVTNKVLLAHVASHQGIVAVKNIMGQPCEMDYEVIPSAIFTDPEIAVVGMTEKMAQKTGVSLEVGKFPFAASGKALTLGEYRGFVKVIKDKATGKLIGGAIIGPHATDLIAELALAIKNQLTPEQVIEVIHAHPTTAETIHEAVLSLEGSAIHF